MRIVVRAGREVSAFDPRRVLREAQDPARTHLVADPDGNMLYLTY